MKATRDEEVERRFAEALLQAGKRERNGIHQSDVGGYCLAKAVWRRMDFASEADVKSEIVKAVGRGQHEILEALKGYVREAEVEWNGITFTIDLLGEELIEIKTTRSYLKRDKETGEEDPTSSLRESYIAQLRNYCVATGRKSGILYVVHITGNVAGRAYRIEFTDEELREAAEAMLRRKAVLEECLELIKKGRKIEEVAAKLAPFSPGYDFECGNCEFKKACPLRGGGDEAR